MKTNCIKIHDIGEKHAQTSKYDIHKATAMETLVDLIWSLNRALSIHKSRTHHGEWFFWREESCCFSPHMVIIEMEIIAGKADRKPQKCSSIIFFSVLLNCINNWLTDVSSWCCGERANNCLKNIITTNNKSIGKTGYNCTSASSCCLLCSALFETNTVRNKIFPFDVHWAWWCWCYFFLPVAIGILQKYSAMRIIFFVMFHKCLMVKNRDTDTVQK